MWILAVSGDIHVTQLVIMKIVAYDFLCKMYGTKQTHFKYPKMPCTAADSESGLSRARFEARLNGRSNQCLCF